ncbi:MAG: Tfp pilus assembly protein PilE [Phycisphaerales bacterium]|jgi:Tfp pilus assembly protein PilE
MSLDDINPPINPDSQPDGASTPDLALSPESREAIDRLLEHGLDPAALDSDDSPAARLLAAIGSPMRSEEPSLIDITLLNSARSDEPQISDEDLQLCPADEEALDALVRAGFELARVPRSLRARAERLHALQRAATTPAAQEPRAELVSRTLAHVQARLDHDSQTFEIGRRRGLTGVRWADVISVAAVMVIASSVVVPVFSAMRSQATRTSCQANMLATASAMGLYAGDNRGSLPVSTAGFGGSWMKVGEPKQSNSANLYTVVTSNYARLNDLACPGNRAAPTVRTDPQATDWDSLDEVSYSYQIVSKFHPNWHSDAQGESPVILADRSPVVLRAAAGEVINPWESSPNHGRRGQHALRTDGSSQWRTEAWPTGEDNIWLPRYIEQVIDLARNQAGLIDGTELPADRSDTFLGP